MKEEIDIYKNSKFYSQKAIGIATFIGGPLAASYLIRENYLSLEDTGKGKNAIIIGIISTILLFSGIFSIPGSIMEYVPNQLFPAIYTGIVYLIVEKLQGKILNQHKENRNDFHSGWKAVGIGFVALLILLGVIFGSDYLSTDNEIYEKYNKEFIIFTNNETETLKIYDEIHTKSNRALLKRIDDFIIPKWKDNIEIIERTNTYDNLPQDLKTQNEVLTEYSELRITSFKLLRKIIQEDTDKYTKELNEINVQIEQVLKKLN